MPAQSALISTVPNGTIPTVAALTSVDVSTVPEGAAVTVLGLNAAGDGGGGTFYFNAGSSAGVNAMSTFATNSTGRWLRANTFSGIAQPPSTAATYSGSQENLVILSGVFPTFSITYTLPPSVTRVGQPELVVKSLTTGLVTIAAAGADKIFDTSEVTSLTTSLVTGHTYRFQAVAGRFYRTDDHMT